MGRRPAAFCRRLTNAVSGDSSQNSRALRGYPHRRRPSQEALFRVEQGAPHRLHPLSSRVHHDPADLDGAALDVHDDEDEVPHGTAKAERLDREEVARVKSPPVRLQERLPRPFFPPLRCRLEPLLRRDIRNRCPAHLDLQPGPKRVAQVRVPQPRFSVAIFTTRARSSSAFRRRPGRRTAEQSYCRRKALETKSESTPDTRRGRRPAATRASAPFPPLPVGGADPVRTASGSSPSRSPAAPGELSRPPAVRPAAAAFAR